MEVINLIQGSASWHSHRANHRNASDTPAVMGVSKYKTRSEFVRERALGIIPEVNAATQARFDDGHRFEALARPLAEEFMREDLAPVVGVSDDGIWSASFDGLTMMGDEAFEHKTLNKSLREAIAFPPPEGTANGQLDIAYLVQMEHQCMVSGARRVLFMASKWDDDDQLIEHRLCWYAPDPSIRARIKDAWEQFDKEVAAYVEPAAKAAPVVAAVQESLPAVSVQVNGQLAIISNLEAFGAALGGYIDRIPKNPTTDQEFADTEAACKALKKAEVALEAAEENALAQLVDVDAMRRLVANYRALARDTRLNREKLVLQRKDELRGEIVAGGIAALREHVKALSVRIGRVQLPARVVDFAGAIHGKKNFDSMREAVKNCLLKAIADANADADAIEANLEVVKELPPEHQAIFPDLSMLALKPADDFLLAVNARIAAHEKAIADRAAELAERDRERIRAEEQEKAQAEASAKAQAEQAKATIEPAQASGGTFGGLVMDSMAFPVKAADKTPVVETIPVDPVSGAGAMMAQAEDSAPTLKLGTIAERLGFSLTADQIKAIVGIDPAAKGRTGTLYHEHQFGAICYGIQRRVRDVFAQFDSK